MIRIFNITSCLPQCKLSFPQQSIIIENERLLRFELKFASKKQWQNGCDKSDSETSGEQLSTLYLFLLIAPPIPPHVSSQLSLLPTVSHFRTTLLLDGERSFQMRSSIPSLVTKQRPMPSSN